MEFKWLEDFVSLAETRSFSRSAALRHVTQPAFSRRIQALEAWVGAELIDRSAYPTRLTQAGLVFYEQALTLLSQAREARTLLRGQGGAPATTTDFAVPHTLALTFFPQWLSRLQQRTGPLRTRLRALNVHDAILSLVEGGCDLVMGYHHSGDPVTLDPDRYDTVALGTERISPFAAPAPDGGPPFVLPGRPNARIPYLSYTRHAYLGRMTEIILTDAKQHLYLDRVYETDMAEGLKAMALAGHGMAFLPHSAIEDALSAGRLVALFDSAGERYTLSMEIRLYRDRLAARGNDPRQHALFALWTAIVEDAREHVSAAARDAA
jgi:DNA-binding transcriptional LysR family regulator